MQVQYTTHQSCSALGRTLGAGSKKSLEDAGAQGLAAAADLQSRGARAFVTWKRGRNGGGVPLGNGIDMCLLWDRYGFAVG